MPREIFDFTIVAPRNDRSRGQARDLLERAEQFAECVRRATVAIHENTRRRRDKAAPRSRLGGTASFLENRDRSERLARKRVPLASRCAESAQKHETNARRVSDDDDWAARAADVAAARARRAELVAGHEKPVAMIETLLFEQGPIGINFETNTDEYRAEADP